MPDLKSPFNSRITRNTLALILAGGRGSRLMHLTAWRAKPAVHFGGKFRIIDFPLSNCINSGIRRIGVLTQYKAHSLILHIQKGWSFLRGEFGEFVELWPAQQRIERGRDTTWYAGTADAVYQNVDIIRNHAPDYVLILAGDHVYKMDYGVMLASHVESGADLTIGCIEVDKARAREFGVLAVDDDRRVVEFQEKPAEPKTIPGKPDTSLASMGIYIFNRDFLFEQLFKDADTQGSSHDFGKDIIPNVIGRYRVLAYPFVEARTGVQAYWRDVGTVDAFWESNLELIGVTPPLNLYDTAWPIWTYQVQLPPAKFVFDDEDRRGMAVDSMVSGGCIISGSTVRHSLLFSNVRVNSFAYVQDSVVLPDVEIKRNCEIRNAVIDRFCEIEEGTQIGVDPDADRAAGFHVTPGGVTLVTPEMLGQQVNVLR
ncbi:glucose-1-phosphate adenylyltransferase [Thiococcus pfennigii]|jgi:glucose-1-phosphate adenylyltransferase|uniref:glucose-1-phosphate adenylyltransferase n=1 Tax=Thiococcus pfennigii TaxID=1057 RepID=UPI001908E941|nr:glucose-1-phosphate adenylyltransferase [Thiococcus pfennigii]MBK1732491.1 glucose-1-phosphate adenylyltransferase [Thiococcus pfennigii]